MYQNRNDLYTQMYLMHHGIKGQKWGIRRFQNSDGTWTAAGKVRRGLERAGQATSAGTKKVAGGATKVVKAAKQKHDEKKERKEMIKEVRETSSASKRKTSDMTNEELREAINRMNLEKQYNTLMRELNPEKVKMSKKFADNMANAIVTQLPNTVVNVGNKVINNAIDKAINKKKADKPFDPNADMSKMSAKEINDYRNAISNYRDAKANQELASKGDWTTNVKTLGAKGKTEKTNVHSNTQTNDSNSTKTEKNASETKTETSSSPKYSVNKNAPTFKTSVLQSNAKMNLDSSNKIFSDTTRDNYSSITTRNKTVSLDKVGKIFSDSSSSPYSQITKDKYASTGNKYIDNYLNYGESTRYVNIVNANTAKRKGRPRKEHETAHYWSPGSKYVTDYSPKKK